MNIIDDDDIYLNDYEIAVLSNIGIDLKQDPRADRMRYEMDIPQCPPQTATAVNSLARQRRLQGYALYSTAHTLKVVVKCIDRESAAVVKESKIREEYAFVQDAYEKYLMALALVGYTDGSIR